MSELSGTVGHPAGVGELAGCVGTKPTHQNWVQNWPSGTMEGLREQEVPSARIWEILGGRPWESGIEGSGVAGVGDDA